MATGLCDQGFFPHSRFGTRNLRLTKTRAGLQANCILTSLSAKQCSTLGLGRTKMDDPQLKHPVGFSGGLGSY